MPPRRMRPDEMLEAIRAFMQREGREPVRRDFETRGNSLPSRQVIERAFRQWPWAVEAAKRQRKELP